MSVVVVGSLNMDIVMLVDQMPIIGETLLGEDVRYFYGGKGANQAVATSKMNVPVKMVGKVGDDTFGDKLLLHMGMTQVAMSEVKREAGTRTGTAAIIKLPEDNAIIVLPGANQKITPEDVSEQVLDEANVLLVQLEIPLATVAETLHQAKEKGVKTILNPAPYHPDVIELIKDVDYITPNEAEFARMMGHEEEDVTDVEADMLAWSKEHTTRLLVTRGGAGVSYVEAGQVKTVAAPKVQVADTTGAGDTFNGIFAAGLDQDVDFETAVKQAVYGASLAVTKMGAQTAMPTKKQLTKFMTE
ncbi:ribokinase [Enterococcus asini ATCC 700915]|uniref:Ribokinase n=1 Tax=Enterococcus asini ATCC 700915 TaxID=1158606 RepID=R2S8C3_9ENTE|nr:ribokinase [Enterococcus asini]EOH89081.1 ribokinase [Enterococcus asini ATCC 700915]EOT55652.1 ribokinase [Enterococcus asini ATCC 700915]OJG12931.1 ribokinase [Enterococcus asini]